MFDLDKWLLSTETEEDKQDMHHSLYRLPKEYNPNQTTEGEIND